MMAFRRAISMPNLAVNDVEMIAAPQQALETPATSIVSRFTRPPSYDEATGQHLNGLYGRLPSFKQSRRARYHPYGRPTLKRKGEKDRYVNTVFDPQYEPLNIPPGYPGMSWIAPLEPNTDIMAALFQRRRRIRRFESARRAQRLEAVMMASRFLESFAMGF